MRKERNSSFQGIIIRLIIQLLHCFTPKKKERYKKLFATLFQKQPKLPNRLLLLRLHLLSSLAQIDVHQRHNLGAADELVADVENEEKHQADVVGEEVGSVPLNEDGETTCDGDESYEESAVVRQVGLERCQVGQLVTRNSLCLHDLLEADVAYVDQNPGDEA